MARALKYIRHSPGPHMDSQMFLRRFEQANAVNPGCQGHHMRFRANRRHIVLSLCHIPCSDCPPAHRRALYKRRHRPTRGPYCRLILRYRILRRSLCYIHLLPKCGLCGIPSLSRMKRTAVPGVVSHKAFGRFSTGSFAIMSLPFRSTSVKYCSISET